MLFTCSLLVLQATFANDHKLCIVPHSYHALQHFHADQAASGLALGGVPRTVLCSNVHAMTRHDAAPATYVERFSSAGSPAGSE